MNLLRPYVTPTTLQASARATVVCFGVLMSFALARPTQLYAHPGVLDVRTFGAIPDDLGDDTAAFQSAVAAAGTGASGSEVYIPRGVYRISSQITITRAITIRGVARDATIVEATNASQNVFKIETGAGVMISDLTIRAQAGLVKTQGAAVLVTAPGGTTNARTVLERLLILDQHTGVHFLNAVVYSLADSSVLSSRAYGVLIENVVEPDAGDGQIIGNVFHGTVPESEAATFAIEHRSGGGLRLVGNKILGHSVGYRVAISDVQTSVALLSANSIELQAQGCIQLRRFGSTGTFSSVTITGNELAHAPVGIAVLDGSPVQPAILNVAITGNVFTQMSSAGIGALTLNGGQISGNVFYVAPMGIYVGPSARNVRIGSNTFTLVTSNVIIDPAATGSSTCTTCN